MKRILAIALLFALPMGLLAQHCGKECCPAKPLDAIRDASVSIMSVSTKGERAAGSGTVFDYQGHTYVLTAAHVFHDDLQFIAVCRDNGRHKKQVVYALPKAMSKTHDLALISLGENVFEAQPLRLCCEPKVGDKLIHCGTAKGLYHQSVHFGHVSGPVRDWKEQGGKMGQANLTVHQGCSGGGVFLECGAFVGVVVQLDGDGVVFYVPTEVVRGFLKAAKCCDCPKCACDPCECGDGCKCPKCPPKPKKKAALPSPSKQRCCDHFGLAMAIISAGEQAQASEWPFVSQAGYWANYHEANAYLQGIGAVMQRLDEMLGIYGLEHHWDGPSALYGGGWHGQQLLQLRGALQAEYHDARHRVDAWSEVWYMMDPAYRDTNGPGAIRRLIDMVGEHDFAAGRWPMPSPWTGWRWR